MKSVYLLVIFIALMTSCVPFKKTVILSKGDEKGVKPKNEIILRDTLTPYKVVVHDLINVQVFTESTTMADMFRQNFDDVNSVQTTDLSTFLRSYTVHENGEITMPLIGSVYVKDKSIPEIEALLKEKLQEHVNYVTVRVKLVGFKVGVLGEVKNANYFTVYAPNINLLQVLSMAGDMTDYADRTKIKVCRRVNDSYEEITVDLVNDYDAIACFYLQPNDVIYVPPLRAKRLKTNSTVIQTTISVATLLVLTLTYLTR